jgi:hypothetical protein
MMHYCNCGQKYITESSAKRCCTTQSKEIEKEIIPRAKRGLKKTPEQQKIHSRNYYLKNRSYILERQRIVDQKKRDEKNL